MTCKQVTQGVSLFPTTHFAFNPVTAVACEVEPPGCFAAIYAFEPGLVSDD